MESARRRSRGVNETIVEAVPTLAHSSESETFASLYERTFPRVYAYVASLVRYRAVAEDVTSQAQQSKDSVKGQAGKS